METLFWALVFLVFFFMNMVHGSNEHAYTCSQYIYIKGTLDYMFRSEITYSKGMYIFYFLR